MVNSPSRRGRDKIKKMAGDSRKMCEPESARRNTYCRQRFYESGYPSEKDEIKRSLLDSSSTEKRTKVMENQARGKREG